MNGSKTSRYATAVLVLALGAIAVAVISKRSEVASKPMTRKAYVMQQLEYAKDRHGVCYAVYMAPTRTAAITSVPCEKVGL